MITKYLKQIGHLTVTVVNNFVRSTRFGEKYSARSKEWFDVMEVWLKLRNDRFRKAPFRAWISENGWIHGAITTNPMDVPER